VSILPQDMRLFKGSTSFPPCSVDIAQLPATWEGSVTEFWVTKLRGGHPVSYTLSDPCGGKQNARRISEDATMDPNRKGHVSILVRIRWAAHKT